MDEDYLCPSCKFPANSPQMKCPTCLEFTSSLLSSCQRCGRGLPLPSDMGFINSLRVRVFRESGTSTGSAARRDTPRRSFRQIIRELKKIQSVKYDPRAVQEALNRPLVDAEPPINTKPPKTQAEIDAEAEDNLLSPEIRLLRNQIASLARRREKLRQKLKNQPRVAVCKICHEKLASASDSCPQCSYLELRARLDAMNIIEKTNPSGSNSRFNSVNDEKKVDSVVHSGKRVVENRQLCRDAINELRKLVMEAMNPVSNVEVSELDIRNAFNLAKKTLLDYSALSKTHVKEYEKEISNLANDVSMKYGYQYL